MKGFNIPFRQIPYQKFQPITRTPQGVQPVLDMEIRNLLAKGAITQIPLSKDGYYSRILLVPKKGGGMRPVIDLSSLNNFVESQHFQMENLSSIKTLLKQGDFMTKLDLEDAYLTIAMNPQSQKLGFLPNLERQSISIQSPSIWPERSASSVYQTTKWYLKVSCLLLPCQQRELAQTKQFKPSSPALLLIHICAQYIVLHTTCYSQKKNELFKKENQIIYSFPISNLTTRLRKRHLLVGSCPLLKRQALTQKFLKLIP